MMTPEERAHLDAYVDRVNRGESLRVPEMLRGLWLLSITHEELQEREKELESLRARAVA